MKIPRRFHIPGPGSVAAVGLALIFAAATAGANEALDILEGRKEASEVTVDPALVDSGGGEEEVDIIPLDDSWAPSPLDPIWARAVLFEDPTNCWVQALAVEGLFHWHGAWGSAEHDVPAAGNRVDNDIDSLRARRLRLGARMRAFYNTTIEGRAEFESDGSYSGIDELKATVDVAKGLRVSFGKIRPAFSIEYSTDPQRLLTPERSALVDQLAPARTLGVMIDADAGRWDYGIGWFSGDADPDIPSVDGNGFILAKLGYRAVDRPEGAAPLHARWHLDYIYNLDGRNSLSIPRVRVPAGMVSANGRQPVVQPWFRHLVSTGVEVRQDRFGFVGDFLLGNGGAANVWGLTVMPSYWIMPGTLRLVGRYHYADTDTPGGIITGLGRDPFFDMTPIYTGDEYHSFYLGANLHLYQDKLVLMGGLEYAMLKDQAGGGFDTDFWIWHTAARVAF